MFEKIKSWLRGTDAATRLCLIMCLVFIISLIPLLWMSFYAHTSGDDYTYGVAAHLAWEETRSLKSVILAAAGTVAEKYYSWQGTFTSIFLMALVPSVISERLYFLTTFVTLGTLILSVSFLSYVIFHFYLKIRPAAWIPVTLSVLLLSTQVIEEGKSAFYWYNGAIHYCFMHSLMVCLIAFYLLFLRIESKGGRVLIMVAACFLAFMTGGSNYVTTLLTPIILVSLIFICMLTRQKKAVWGVLPLSINLICLFINVSAPGNAVRMATMDDSMGAIEAIYYSFQYAIDGIGGWLSVYVLFFTLLTLPFLAKELYKINFSFPLPGLVAAYSSCIVAASYTPSLYSMGHTYIFERTINIMQMLFYLLYFLNVVYLTGWVTAKWRSMRISPEIPELLSKLKKVCGKSFAAAAAVFFITLLVFSDNEDITSLSAAKSIVKGYAQSYHEESLYRIALLTMEGVDEVWVPNFTVYPTLLDEQALSEDPTDYRNVSLAEWYGVDKVYLSEIY